MFVRFVNFIVKKTDLMEFNFGLLVAVYKDEMYRGFSYIGCLWFKILYVINLILNLYPLLYRGGGGGGVQQRFYVIVGLTTKCHSPPYFLIPG